MECALGAYYHLLYYIARLNLCIWRAVLGRLDVCPRGPSNIFPSSTRHRHRDLSSQRILCLGATNQRCPFDSEELCKNGILVRYPFVFVHPSTSSRRQRQYQLAQGILVHKTLLSGQHLRWNIENHSTVSSSQYFLPCPQTLHLRVFLCPFHGDHLLQNQQLPLRNQLLRP